MNAINQRLRAACALLLLALCVAPYVPAQSGGFYEITQSVIASGGGDRFGGLFSLAGTIGQAVAGRNGAANYFLASGFEGGLCPSITLNPAPRPALTSHQFLGRLFDEFSGRANERAPWQSGGSVGIERVDDGQRASRAEP